MNKVITISREYGAGGQAIAKRVAEELGITIYDTDIVRETVKASGFDFDLVRREEEEVSKTNSFFKSLWASSAFYPDPQEVIHDVQQAVILKFAKEGPCVILGRGADAILRKAGIDSLNVFIHASELHRAVRLQAETGITDATELQKLMAKHDNNRRAYYTHYTGKQWGDSKNYHLTLDSGILGEDLCVKLILEAANA